MSLSHSPSVVTNGLVLYYDMNNTQKSWRGAPTTNVIASDFDVTFESLADGNTVGFINQLGTGGYLGVSSSIGYSSNKSLKINNGTSTTYSRVYRTTPVLLGEYTTVSCWVYSTVAGPSLSIEYNGGDYTWSVPQSKNTHSGSGWEKLYTSTTYTATSNTMGYYFFYPGIDNTDTFWDSIQVEKQAFATPFVTGTRSNTQAVLDLTGNNTVTANSLTYASDGTFSFNGSSNYIASSYATTSSQALTVCGWLYSTESAATYRNFFDSNTVNPMIWWNTAGRIEFDTGSNHTSTNVYRNQWVHVALSKPSGNSSASYFVNGALSGTSTTAYTVPATTPTWFNRGATGTWLGKSDSVAVYNRALSAAEVSQNFNAARGRYGI